MYYVPKWYVIFPNYFKTQNLFKPSIMIPRVFFPMDNQHSGIACYKSAFFKALFAKMKLKIIIKCFIWKPSELMHCFNCNI